MAFSFHLADINWLAALVSTVVAFACGAVWYSRALFGEKWMSEVGLSDESVNSANMGKIFGTTFVLQFVAASALSLLIGRDSTWLIGLHTGATVGVLWIATAYAVTYLFEQRTVRLWLINAGYYVLLYAVMGTILGAWPA